jgi:hypothetical protein
MIDRKLQPVEWAALLYELGDALAHLGSLIKDIEARPGYSDGDLRVDLGHVYAHLNRAWWQSSKPLSEDDWELASRFPDDLAPAG